jgi:hypothetical protein
MTIPAGPDKRHDSTLLPQSQWRPFDQNATGSPSVRWSVAPRLANLVLAKTTEKSIFSLYNGKSGNDFARPALADRSGGPNGAVVWRGGSGADPITPQEKARPTGPSDRQSSDFRGGEHQFATLSAAYFRDHYLPSYATLQQGTAKAGEPIGRPGFARISGDTPQYISASTRSGRQTPYSNSIPYGYNKLSNPDLRDSGKDPNIGSFSEVGISAGDAPNFGTVILGSKTTETAKTKSYSKAPGAGSAHVAAYRSLEDTRGKESNRPVIPPTLLPSLRVAGDGSFDPQGPTTPRIGRSSVDDAGTSTIKQSNIVGEIWLDTLSLQDWLQAYLSSQFCRASRNTTQMKAGWL